ncbi:MAG TPA: hypothetical protein VG890_10485 [Puia sp.]|nr:hypothetical protein [Puia sp.]
MKCLSFCCILLFAAACQQPKSQEINLLKTRIDSLQQTIANSYRPGLGEFMSAIQLHHEKLWFAGKNQNWALADFEIHEIMEALDDINHYCQDRPEVRDLPMISPALDSLAGSIKNKNLSTFNRNYFVLTETCNSCHQATQHGFNRIKVPETSSFPDQDFSVQTH